VWLRFRFVHRQPPQFLVDRTGALSAATAACVRTLVARDLIPRLWYGEIVEETETIELPIGEAPALLPPADALLPAWHGAISGRDFSADRRLRRLLRAWVARPTRDCLATRQEYLMRVGLERWLDANARLLPAAAAPALDSLAAAYRLSLARGFWLDDSSLLITGVGKRDDRLCLIAAGDRRLKPLAGE
jgi:hypothetical protein